MKTELFKMKDELEEAARLIKNGELVAVPTETVYGLAVNGLDDEAVRKIYELKGRPPAKPLSLMVSDAADIEKYCADVPQAAYTLAEKFWPGPLTIVLRARSEVSSVARAGGETVGLRCPDHEMTLGLIKKAGLPLAAPSANPSGAESPKTSEEVLDYFDGKIAAVVDGGPCGLGVESTVIDLSAAPYGILRHGSLPEEEIDRALVGAMTIIGVTGGTGSGKTTALAALEKHGALVIDCDEVYHELTEDCAEMLSELEARFPSVVPDGKLDRKALGAAVFRDPRALEELNAITHKYVGMRVDALLRQWARAGGAVAAIDAIALLESDIRDKCAAVVGIIADTETRIDRLMAREGISREYAELRVSAQKTNEYFQEKCDYILSNDAGIGEFEEKCDALFHKIIGGKDDGRKEK